MRKVVAMTENTGTLGAGRPRDSQRMKLYRAEDNAEREAPYARLDDLHDMRAWLATIIRSQWWLNRWPYVVDLDVRDGRGRKGACGSCWHNGNRLQHNNPAILGELCMPRHYRSQGIILHELAHVATDAHFGGLHWKSQVAAHGPEFARTYLELIAQYCGTFYADILRDQFHLLRVKVAPVPDYSVRIWNGETLPVAAPAVDDLGFYGQRLLAETGG